MGHVKTHYINGEHNFYIKPSNPSKICVDPSKICVDPSKIYIDPSKICVDPSKIYEWKQHEEMSETMNKI